MTREEAELVLVEGYDQIPRHLEPFELHDVIVYSLGTKTTNQFARLDVPDVYCG